MLRIPVQAYRAVICQGSHFPNSRLIDGSEAVSLMHRPCFKPQEDSWYWFLLRLRQPQGHSMARSRNKRGTQAKGVWEQGAEENIWTEGRMDRKTGGLKGLHNQELHNLCSLPSIIRIIKTRKMWWARHVTWMGGKWNAYRIQKERDH
jgi:hypothetical protein